MSKIEIVEIVEIENTANFQAQFSLLKFDYFLLKFASKIAFGRRELKKKNDTGAQTPNRLFF